MKIMTCRQLGGACEVVFQAETFEEMAELSKQHGMAMFKADDSAHLEAMEKMQVLMKNPDDMTAWLAARRQDFDGLPTK